MCTPSGKKKGGNATCLAMAHVQYTSSRTDIGNTARDCIEHPEAPAKTVIRKVTSCRSAKGQAIHKTYGIPGGLIGA